jgi:hypothetical protein
VKTSAEIHPNYGPVYAAALYPEMAKIFQAHGYALAVHGSLARDLDLIAVPWVENPSPPDDVLREICSKFAVRECGTGEPRPHGRIARMLSVGFGHCAVDLSFFPSVTAPPPPSQLMEG